ncbi:hypothetical protein Dda_1313 [Drechslerella dactyloides]|uniref:Dynactin subunit n=1 Tax=Drechslerella dactyloides TaxID=74499 RepID=A0AAD6J5Z5_DREDA|nr:hypothetical protein Dda_1313 [Drechslerella dactyloides]
MKYATIRGEWASGTRRRIAVVENGRVPGHAYFRLRCWRLSGPVQTDDTPTPRLLLLIPHFGFVNNINVHSRWRRNLHNGFQPQIRRTARHPRCGQDITSKDVFETPDLTDDSTLPVGTARPTTRIFLLFASETGQKKRQAGDIHWRTSPSRIASSRNGNHSPASSRTDDDEEDAYDESREISHPRLHPRVARGVFTNAQVDATGVDFSDRIASKRKSYRTSTRRRRRNRVDERDRELYGDDVEDEMFDDAEEGDSDGEEGVGKRLARLRREMEELKEMIEDEKREKEEIRREQQDRDGADAEAAAADHDDDVEDPDEDGWERLAEVMEELMTAKGKGGGAEADLARKLANGLKVPPPATALVAAGGGTAPAATSTPSDSQQSGVTASYTVTYSPHFKKAHTLAKVAEFDSRITLLERLLGISATQSLSSIPTNFAIISSLETLTQQLTVLTNTSASSLDSAARRVKGLTADAEKLTEARKAAKAALESRRAAGEEEVAMGGIPEGASYLADAENEAKINALYGTLDTIDRLSPLLPAVLDRLRSLRGVHGEAARSVQTLEAVEKRQEEMQIEIQKWKEALEKVEGAVAENEKTVGGNMRQVEKWVQVLEEKVQRLG